jgi:hypothetical protein
LEKVAGSSVSSDIRSGGAKGAHETIRQIMGSVRNNSNIKRFIFTCLMIIFFSDQFEIFVQTLFSKRTQEKQFDSIRAGQREEKHLNLNKVRKGQIGPPTFKKSWNVRC